MYARYSPVHTPTRIRAGPSSQSHVTAPSLLPELLGHVAHVDIALVLYVPAAHGAETGMGVSDHLGLARRCQII